MKLIAVLICLTLSGCGIGGKINRTTTTTTMPDGRVIVEESCSAEYTNNSWGTADSRAVNGCDAGGGSEGTDNSQMVSIPLSMIQSIPAIP